MDKNEAEAIASRMLNTFHWPEKERWRGFTAIVSTYSDATEREATEKLFERFAEQKPPAMINGVRFRMAGVRLEEETPNAGRLVAEYRRDDE